MARTLRTPVDFEDVAASPANPAAGIARLFSKNGRFWQRSSSGVEVPLTVTELLDAQGQGGLISNNGNDNDIYRFTIPAAKAIGLFEFDVAWNYFNNSAASRTLTVKWTYANGSGTIGASAVGAGNVNHPGSLSFKFYIPAQGASVAMNMQVRGLMAGGIAQFDNAGFFLNQSMSVANYIDNTAAHDFALIFNLGAANANLQVTRTNGFAKRTLIVV